MDVSTQRGSRLIPQLTEPFHRLEAQKQRFLEILGQSSPTQLAFRTQPEAWNMIQVGHHVAIVELRTADSIRKHRGIRSSRRSWRYRVGNVGLWLVLRTGIRVRNPVPEVEPEVEADLPQLLELWDRARDDLENVLSEVKERGLSYAAFKHPIAGPFSIEEAVRFLVAHLDHHLRQLERIRRHPSFPDAL